MHPLTSSGGGGSGGGTGTAMFAATSLDELLVMAGRIGAVLVLAGFLAYRPWRFFMNRPRMGHEIAQAQVLIAIAGSIMVAIIGDNVARAFGLVGLGGLIRFRSGIKDTRDAAVMFSMIALGMACGLGLVEIAAVVTVCVSLVSFGFDLFTRPEPELYRVAITVDDAGAALPALARVLPASRVVAAPFADAAPHRIVVEVASREAIDVAALHGRLAVAGVPGIRMLEVEDA
jgi:Domain of unknown function (DUF4956)